MDDKQNKNARILIVDDIPKNTQVLGTILRQEGYQINIARNGEDALKLTEKVQPDMILLDILMPQMDGFETCKQLKASPATQDIPVIFLTARTDSDDIVRGFELGAVDYVSKPFNAKELLVRVRTHLELKFSRDMIEKASNERKELIHVLCHDLSNPFNAIISALNMMKDDYSMFGEIKDQLLAMAKNGADLIRLIRRMRALEEHKLELHAVNLANVINISEFLLNERFSEKQIRPEIHVDKNLTVLAEETSFINSVMNNLLTNAIKFSSKGSKIIIRAESEGDYIKISVRDFGIGIPETILKDLFDISKATHRAGTEGEVGTGFGMPLVKKFITAYGGTIEVFSKEAQDSPDNHGTEIKLKLKKK